MLTLPNQNPTQHNTTPHPHALKKLKLGRVEIDLYRKYATSSPQFKFSTFAKSNFVRNCCDDHENIFIVPEFFLDSAHVSHGCADQYLWRVVQPSGVPDDQPLPSKDAASKNGNPTQCQRNKSWVFPCSSPLLAFLQVKKVLVYIGQKSHKIVKDLIAIIIVGARKLWGWK